MNLVEVEIFQQTPSFYELRLFTGGGRPKTRGLNQTGVDRLIGLVKQVYIQDAIEQRVFGSPQLGDLGRELFTFLDGDERWLSSILNDPAGTVLRITTAVERLRHLPWELLARDGSFLSVAGRAPLLPVRAVGANTAVT